MLWAHHIAACVLFLSEYHFFAKLHHRRIWRWKEPRISYWPLLALHTSLSYIHLSAHHGGRPSRHSRYRLYEIRYFALFLLCLFCDCVIVHYLDPLSFKEKHMSIYSIPSHLPLFIKSPPPSILIVLGPQATSHWPSSNTGTRRCLCYSRFYFSHRYT